MSKYDVIFDHDGKYMFGNEPPADPTLILANPVSNCNDDIVKSPPYTLLRIDVSATRLLTFVYTAPYTCFVIPFTVKFYPTYMLLPTPTPPFGI